MQTFDLTQIQAAQDYRPQIERFITASTIYVVESMADYATLPAEVQAMIAQRNEMG